MPYGIEDVFLRLLDFKGSTTVYTNPLLKGQRFRLIRDKDMILEPNVDYVKIENGFELKGFEITDDTVIVIQFY